MISRSWNSPLTGRVLPIGERLQTARYDYRHGVHSGHRTTGKCKQTQPLLSRLWVWMIADEETCGRHRLHQKLNLVVDTPRQLQRNDKKWSSPLLFLSATAAWMSLSSRTTLFVSQTQVQKYLFTSTPWPYIIQPTLFQTTYNELYCVSQATKSSLSHNLHPRSDCCSSSQTEIKRQIIGIWFKAKEIWLLFVNNMFEDINA